MSAPIDPRAVAISLMREALSLLDSGELATAAAHLQRAIEAAEAAGTGAYDNDAPYSGR